jgi:hypothetical protein
LPAERGRARRLFAFVAHVLPHLDRSGCAHSSGVSSKRVCVCASGEARSTCPTTR